MTNCYVVFQMGSFTSWCKTHESKADTERQCCMTGLDQRATTAERERDEARADVARLTAESDEAQDEIERMRNESARQFEPDWREISEDQRNAMGESV